MPDSSSILIDSLISTLQNEFTTKDLDPHHYFLGVGVTHSLSGLYLTQYKCAKQLLDRHDLSTSKPIATPLSSATKMPAY